jgi:hypothetical protein
MKLEFSWQIFDKSSNIKFHENWFSGSWVVPCGQMDGQTNTMKLIVAFPNFQTHQRNVKSSRSFSLLIDDYPNWQEVKIIYWMRKWSIIKLCVLLLLHTSYSHRAQYNRLFFMLLCTWRLAFVCCMGSMGMFMSHCRILQFKIFEMFISHMFSFIV